MQTIINRSRRKGRNVYFDMAISLFQDTIPCVSEIELSYHPYFQDWINRDSTTIITSYYSFLST